MDNNEENIPVNHGLFHVKPREQKLLVYTYLFEPSHEKISNLGFRPGQT